MTRECLTEDVESRFRAVRHPHILGLWCYRQSDEACAHLRVGQLEFAEAGAEVCAIADIVDVKPERVLAFLQDKGYVTARSGIDEAGICAAIEHFGGAVLPAAKVGLQPASESGNLAALQKHLLDGMPAIVYLRDGGQFGREAGEPSSRCDVAVAAGYDAGRGEMLLFVPRGAEYDGRYSWPWVAGRVEAFILAVAPEEDRYTPRSIFKQIYGIDIAGHEQRWPNIDLEILQGINPDCIGWIHLDGTPLTYPIVKDHFDGTYYQTHNFSGEPSVHGAVSLSFSNGGSFEASNLVFSAHRMKDYSMFKMLTFYDRPDFSAEHPCIDLLLGNSRYFARVFSAYCFPKGQDEHDSFCVDFSDDADFEGWIRQRFELSMHPFAFNNEKGFLHPKIATFRTCYGFENDQTFVVHALLEHAIC